MKHRFNMLFLAVGLGVCMTVFFTDGWKMLWSMLGVLAIFGTIVSFGVIRIRWNYFFKSLSKWKNDQTLLTFDDGPDPELTPQVLDTLKAHGIRAIFFLIGQKAEQHPELVKRIVQEGHLIGNHSYAHNNFMSMQRGSKVQADLEHCQEVLLNITGQKVKLFRPPVGYTNPIIGRVLSRMNLMCVGWTIRSFDSVIKDEQQLVKRLISLSQPGAIVLLHDNLPVTAKSLPQYIRTAEQNGIIFVRSFA